MLDETLEVVDFSLRFARAPAEPKQVAAASVKAVACRGLAGWRGLKIHSFRKLLAGFRSVTLSQADRSYDSNEPDSPVVL